MPKQIKRGQKERKHVCDGYRRRNVGLFVQGEEAHRRVS